jgi:hypothetical protein
MDLNRRKVFALGAAAFAAGIGVASAEPSVAASARSLPGDFRDGYASVNGTRLHYVAGGRCSCCPVGRRRGGSSGR